MKEFLKFTLATIVGIVLASIILFFIGVISVVGIVASSETETQVKPNTVLILNLNGSVAERGTDNPFQKFMKEEYSSYGLDDILNSIKKAKENEDIKGIYIKATSLNTGFASLEAIRDALVDFKESGKFIIAYSDAYSQGLYYLSSVADKVMLNPQGAIEWKGLASQPMFLKDLLQKLGIEMQIFKVGTYKSAVEPFIATEMSPANKEQVTAYIGSIWSTLLKDVSTSRKISVDSLNAYADKMLAYYPATESVTYGLADTLVYQNEVRAYIKDLMNIPEDKTLNTLGLTDMINIKKNTPKDKSGHIIAVYYAFGEIDGGSSSTDGISSNELIKDLRKLKEDKDVKAVVLRVNSPGGSAFGSEQIWFAMEELKKEKPVIVSMGDYAASGGYYISCNADSIVAEPTTLTGSIGVFGMIPNAKGLAGKIGVTFDVVKTNTYSDMGSINRALNDSEKSLIQMNVNQIYDLFITRCAEGRGMSKEKLHQIAEGRVWSGSEAKRLGLIDELGGLDKAIEIASKKAETTSYTLISYPEKKSIFDEIINSQPTNYIKSRFMKESLGEYYETFEFVNGLGKADKIQARIPFNPNIN